jgi:cobalamin synthase
MLKDSHNLCALIDTGRLLLQHYPKLPVPKRSYVLKDLYRIKDMQSSLSLVPLVSLVLARLPTGLALAWQAFLQLPDATAAAVATTWAEFGHKFPRKLNAGDVVLDWACTPAAAGEH